MHYPCAVFVYQLYLNKAKKGIKEITARCSFLSVFQDFLFPCVYWREGGGCGRWRWEGKPRNLWSTCLKLCEMCSMSKLPYPVIRQPYKNIHQYYPISQMVERKALAPSQQLWV